MITRITHIITAVLLAAALVVTVKPMFDKFDAQLDSFATQLVVVDHSKAK